MTSRQRTRLALTKAGRQALEAHVAESQRLLSSTTAEQPVTAPRE